MIECSFFQRDPLTCARDLIGCELVWKECAGIIVETEAYAAQGDEACHTFMRPSAREFIATHDAGTAYVYINYGVHWLLNVLVKDDDSAGTENEGFVLIRALEPTRGVELMQKRRFFRSNPDTQVNGEHAALRALCSGPGKLTQALGVRGADHGRDLCATEGAEHIGFLPRARPVEIITDVRIGISKAAHLPWRFLLKDSPFVSVRPRNRDKPSRNIKHSTGRKRRK